MLIVLQIEERILKDHPALPLYHSVQYTLVKPYVKDLKVTPMGLLNLKDTRLVSKGAATGQVSGEPEWQIGEMGLGYHEARQMFVLVASQGAVGESTEAPPDDDSPSVRFWLRHDQVIAFSKQAESVLSAGRPLCPRCGLPMDPAGHPCPVMNGARPIF